MDLDGERKRTKPRVRPPGQAPRTTRVTTPPPPMGLTPDPEPIDATSQDYATRDYANQDYPTQNYVAPTPPAADYESVDTLTAGERTLELREEQLVARKDLREVGEVRVRTTVEEVPARLEVEASREEVEVEHVPVGEFVTERMTPWEEDGVLVVPVYEEQLMVVKRLMLREHLRIRRVGTTERRLFEETLRRERLVIEDPTNSHLVHERYQTDDDAEKRGDERREDDHGKDEGGLLGNLVRKALG
jgi:uncharacterized protein (TIGR02271 family)